MSDDKASPPFTVDTTQTEPPRVELPVWPPRVTWPGPYGLDQDGPNSANGQESAAPEHPAHAGAKDYTCFPGGVRVEHSTRRERRALQASNALNAPGWPGPRGREASSPYRTPEPDSADTTHGHARQVEGLREQLAYAQDELGALARENERLIKTVDEYKTAQERQRQLGVLSGSAFVKELAAEFEAEKADDAQAAPLHAAPTDIDALGKSARTSYLSLTHKPTRGLLGWLAPNAPPAAWEALPDDVRSAWCAAALAAVLTRDIAASSGQP